MDALAVGELLGKELLPIVLTLFFFNYILKPIKEDIHSMRGSVQNLFIKLAEMKDVKTDLDKLEHRLHELERACQACKIEKLS